MPIGATPNGSAYSSPKKVASSARPVVSFSTRGCSWIFASAWRFRRAARSRPTAPSTKSNSRRGMRRRAKRRASSILWNGRGMGVGGGM